MIYIALNCANTGLSYILGLDRHVRLKGLPPRRLTFLNSKQTPPTQSRFGDY